MNPHHVALFAGLAVSTAAAAGGALPTAVAREPQRLAQVVTRVVDGGGEPIEDVNVALLRCFGRRRFTTVPSFSPANPTGVPLQNPEEGCDGPRETTDEQGEVSFFNVQVGLGRITVERDATLSYLLLARKEGYTTVRRVVTPHVARNELDLVLYRTVGERMFELVDEAQAAAAGGDFAAAEAAMIQSTAMMRAQMEVRGIDAPDLLIESLRYLTWVQLSAGNDIAALDTLDELLLLAPDDPYGLRVSGVIAVSRGDWELAEANFRSYLLFHPESPDAHMMMGNLRLEAGELDEAVEHLETAIAIDPEFTLAYRSLGTTYEQLGRLREATSAFERYLELAGEPDDAVQIRATIAMLRR
ncbi:MAG: tetratricopeptide repeat protein [Acidobacteriota bacterium]